MMIGGKVFAAVLAGFVGAATGNEYGCAVLVNYKEGARCTGEPVKKTTFPTMVKPGSPCIHWEKYWIKNQYCDLSDPADPKFRQEVYLGENCTGTLSNQTYDTKSCLYNFKLASCSTLSCSE
uniref:Secreted protein n=1 Tax=Mucochytrium quahogii TaxID=96639 RepID=A0A7S2SJB9_9STRA|mmetsp:Transcript_37852/g.61566  ORF Transcript_37852/g.61566 Transcript_37852/m.61566 type:complete len:122 (+) Transcript_37852:318-683(+)|eukprot:CAMPEP_0203784606 /NCGR_PEP_ID=MMETSP0100_2-20121128/555_1 /ASSEMBLY_ACC=CAM_ASM_000210 /TAXON_ID=96639 /ORGANISM=" , Strain NY0313808BC1" /LENGTH=121 /DNA_ID=CAMNT_0050686597 /DNA_START=151 /DNA_END=516 /DNA_ORIENTATION=+